MSLLTMTMNLNRAKDLSDMMCEEKVIVQGDEGPVCGVVQVVDCHAVTVGHQEREEVDHLRRVIHVIVHSGLKGVEGVLVVVHTFS